MLKKIIISVLAITVVGAGAAAAAYNFGLNQAVPTVASEEGIVLASAQSQSSQGNGYGQAGQGQDMAQEQQAQEPLALAEGLTGRKREENRPLIGTPIGIPSNQAARAGIPPIAQRPDFSATLRPCLDHVGSQVQTGGTPGPEAFGVHIRLSSLATAMQST